MHGKLQKAHDELETAKQKWTALTLEQQQTGQKLIDATNSAIAATQKVTVQAEAMTSALIPMAKAIEQVNFPLRLDKIDLGISTQASTMATFQGAIDRGFNGVKDELTGMRENATKEFGAVKSAQVDSRKMQIFIIVLLLFNLAAVGSLVAFFFRR